MIPQRSSLHSFTFSSNSTKNCFLYACDGSHPFKVTQLSESALESLVSLGLLEIRKTSITHSLTTWNQEMLAHLKIRSAFFQEWVYASNIPFWGLWKGTIACLFLTLPNWAKKCTNQDGSVPTPPKTRNCSLGRGGSLILRPRGKGGREDNLP